ncbi:hypothetical protein DL98DRAFT_611875 [Cadophora sp. DSE1049]|nr:hypothetical protein DL98DRAFT_611875 [Cadophora sp. DSE1049]
MLDRIYPELQDMVLELLTWDRLSSSAISKAYARSQNHSAGSGSSEPTYRGGRGGAGNYFDDGEEARRIEEERVEEEGRKREVQGRVEEDVERGLKKPERAYSGN